MSTSHQVRVLVDGEADEVFDLTGELRLELLELDVDAVDPAPATDAPAGSKGLATAIGTLVVSLGAGGLGPLIASVRAWASRNRRDVEVTIDGDVLKVSGVSAQQQDKIIDAWLSRHA